MDSAITKETFENEERTALAKTIMKLFSLWGLLPSEQLALLGLSAKSKNSLSRYRKGGPLPPRPDIMRRVGLLLSVHKALAVLYPLSPEIRYSWVKHRNTFFDGQTPLEVMIDEGAYGITRVAAYLTQHE